MTANGRFWHYQLPDCIMLILIGWRARPLASAMLANSPITYAVGFVGIKVNSAAHAPSQADLVADH